jgi:glucokinase
LQGAKDAAGAAADADEVIRRARAGDATAKHAAGILFGWLAAMASDVALMLGARGGIYLSGVLLEAAGDLIDPAAFSARYTDKGRLTDYVTKIPVFHFTLPEQMIHGLTTLFEHDLHSA